jgi:hypothetical protein
VTESKEHTNEQVPSEQQLTELTEQILAGPGVLEMMEVYEAAERAYTAAVVPTIPEPRIWFTTSTT